MKKYQIIENFLIRFLKDELYKTDFKNTVVGLSGGIDSAVVAVLAQKAFGEDFLAIMLPSKSSSQSSLDDAKELCEKFGIANSLVYIGDLVDTYFKDTEATKLRVGNFSARMRMSVLYDISAKNSALVLGTSNKSEILLGYGTMFGDLACAFNPIGDMYKTEIFEFAEHLGVPECIINKTPSADLWEGQSDEEELGFSYEELDAVLKALVDKKLNQKKLLQRNFNKEIVNFVINKIDKNKFKRVLPTIAKLDHIKGKEQ